jgi:hypothetical protein
LANVPDPQLAEQSLGRLMELSPEMRGGAILGDETPPPAPGGQKRQAIVEADMVLAATSDADAWGDAASALLDAADRSGDAAEQVHVATEVGEVFAVREAGLVAVAVTGRFVLASLMAFDMRSVLRDLAAGRAETGSGA